MSDLAALERAVLAAAPEDAPPVSTLLSGPDTDAPSFDPAPDADTFDLPPDASGVLIDPATFQQRFADMHDMAGGMVQMRTGKPCPLGDQARGPGGQIAAQALYSLCQSSPMLSRMFLSQDMGIIGSLVAIGMHGFACIQIVKASAADQAAEAVAA